MDQPEFHQTIEDIRRFNRFFTKQIGVLHEKLLRSPFSLTEARVIYDLARLQPTTARALGSELGLDPGYLSRILGGFQKKGLVESHRSEQDGRQRVLGLTALGRKAFDRLNSDSREEIGAMLNKLSAPDLGRLKAAMCTIQGLLVDPPETKVSYILRNHRPGDMGWIVGRHAEYYCGTYSADAEFEADVAEIVFHFLMNFDPGLERCWIAEKDGENVGSVMVVKNTRSEAKLRLLLVDPKARGLGIGTRLVDECIRFARQAGYSTMILATNQVLTAARKIYAQAGFRFVKEVPHKHFGRYPVGEIWSLDL